MKPPLIPTNPIHSQRDCAERKHVCTSLVLLRPSSLYQKNSGRIGSVNVDNGAQYATLRVHGPFLLEAMKVGDQFPTYGDLQAAVQQYSEEKLVHFYVRDCRSISAAKTKVKRFISDKLEKYQVLFCCIKGGKAFKSRSNGERTTR